MNLMMNIRRTYRALYSLYIGEQNLFLTNGELMLFCSACGKRLFRDCLRRYVTLTEHVMDPNGIPPLRISFVCTNEKCPLRLLAFFGIQGARYQTGNIPKRYKNRKFWSAIGSWDWWWHRVKTRFHSSKLRKIVSRLADCRSIEGRS